MCQLAFVKLSRDDGTLLRQALANIRKWQEAKTCSAFYVRRWREILGMPMRKARALVLDDTDEAAALRQNHPFAGFFSNAERHRLRARHE